MFGALVTLSLFGQPCHAQIGFPATSPNVTSRQPFVEPDRTPKPSTEILSAQQIQERIAWVDKLLSFVNPDGKTIGTTDIIYSVNQLTAYRAALAGSVGVPLAKTSGKAVSGAKTPGITLNAVVRNDPNSPNNPAHRWGYYIPYQFTTSGSGAVSFAHQNDFLSAAKRWEQVCWVKFVPRTNETDYVIVVDDSYLGDNGNNTSSVGRQGGSARTAFSKLGLPNSCPT